MPASSTAVILLVTQVVLDLLPLLAPVALFRVGPWPGVTVLTSAALPAILAGLIVSGPLVAGSVTALAQVLVGLVYAWRGLRDRARLVLTPLVMFGAVQLAGLGYHAVAGVAPTSLASTRVLAAAVLAGFVLITVKVGFVGCWSAVILHRPLGRTIHDYLRSATPKLEALMVLLGPVLAVMYQLQPVAGLLGLVPLFGLYYLSSIEQRLERQTWELQRTASDLHAAVGRREQVEQTLAQITAAQEEERRRIARELHDDTVQRLLLLSRSLEAYRESLRPTRQAGAMPQVAEALGRWRATVEEIAQAVRRFCMDLRPAILNDLGLVPALRWLVRNLSSEHPIEADLRVRTSPPRLDAETELALFRIVQEALSNVRRHAEASQVLVEVEAAEQLRITVRDNGRGFHVSDNREDHVGLQVMRERARMLGGELRVTSTPGAGTTVEVSVPLSGSGQPSSLAPDAR